MSAPHRSGIPRLGGSIPRPTAGAGLGAIPRRSSPPPASRLRQPAVGVSQPGSGLRQPGSGLRQPSSGLRQPSSGLRQPSSGLRQPAVGVSQPGSGLRQPGSGLRQPSSGLRQPSSGLRQPSSGLRQPGFGLRQPSSGLRQPGSGLRQPAAITYEGYQKQDTPQSGRRLRSPVKLHTSPEQGIMSVSVADSPTSPRRNILVPESTVTSGALAVPVEEAYDDVVHTDEVQRVLEETRNNAVRELRRREAKERREVKRQLVEAQNFRRQFISSVLGDAPIPDLAMPQNCSPSMMLHILEERMPLTAGIGREMIEDIELRTMDHPVAGGILDVWAGERQLAFDLEKEEPPEGFYDDSYEEDDYWNRSPDEYYDLDPELMAQEFPAFHTSTPRPQSNYGSVADWYFPSTPQQQMSTPPSIMNNYPDDLIHFS